MLKIESQASQTGIEIGQIRTLKACKKEDQDLEDVVVVAKAVKLYHMAFSYSLFQFVLLEHAGSLFFDIQGNTVGLWVHYPLEEMQSYWAISSTIT